MSQSHPTDAEKAMNANADSRVQQGRADDKASHQTGGGEAETASPPASTDLTGPGGDPAEGKR